MHRSNVLYQHEGHVSQCTVSNAHTFSKTTEEIWFKSGTLRGRVFYTIRYIFTAIGFPPGGNKKILEEFNSGSNKDGACAVPGIASFNQSTYLPIYHLKLMKCS